MRFPVLATLLLASAGCASSGGVPVARSVLATRAPQTRSYEAVGRQALFNALVQGLQDAGFQLAAVEAEAGFVAGSAQRIEGRDAPGAVKLVLWPYAMAFPRLFGNRRHTVVEVTGTVLEEGAVPRLRLVCRTKVLDGSGALTSLHEVEDPVFYQELFARVDKALFLEREGI